ncbi:MAG: DNA-3-methyladenine glycosylase 2 family protein [Planctomycetota bacterium]|nr:DNA-3-methyladenine glycosylase 2 family protein [Planctomycetota bacterium]
MTKQTYRPTRACNALMRREPRFRRLVEAVGKPVIPQSDSTFETLARSIVYQQLSGRAASTIFGRLLDKFDDRVLDPAALLRKRMTTLRGAGLSQAKANSVRDLARHVVDGRLDPAGLHTLSDDEVMDALTQVKGIGPWSARMHLMFALKRRDVWPVGDLGVRKGLQVYLGLDDVPTAKEAEPLGDPYRPHRTMFAWYMWRVLDVEDWA